MLRHMRIVLSISDKLNYPRAALPPLAVAPKGQQIAPEILFDAMLKAHEQTLNLPKNNAPALHAIRADKVQKGKKHNKPQPQKAARGQNQGNGKNKHAYAPKPKIPPPPKREDPTKDSIYHECKFLDHLKDHGIIAHRTPPYTPQHNGVSERRNRTLLDMVRSMMSQTTLPKSFWDYALETAARILNMVPTKKGCEALVKRDTLIKPDKLEPKSIKCIFVGYPKETMGYSFYYPPENKVLVARNAEFLENSLITQEASGSLEDLEIIQEEDTHPSIDTSLNHEEDDLEIDEPQSDIIPIRSEPANYKAALLDPESDKWLNAMNVEMQSMKDNEVWDLVDLPPNGKTVGSKWLFKKKTDMDGAVHTYKARLVAKGYTQTPGIDYEETFSYDAKCFLKELLNEEVYMEQPEGFVNPKYPKRVCKLKRSIYGLKQASRQWNKRFDDEIKKFGFTQNADEPCVYLKASGSNVIFLIFYVDDILIMGNNIPMLQDVRSYLGRCFAMKDLGEAAYILGIKIYIDRS
ncbi:retrotransposon protein, putative, ty1-copia subclass [Tanacetum coccineum]